jgi:branched-subunit amino acid permease
MQFDSLNPYESLAVVISDSPQALVEDLKKIRTPIKIVSIVQIGNRSAAYIMGDVRITKNKKVKKDGSDSDI